MKTLVLQDQCPDCGVKRGQVHQPGCDVERCPFCGGQMIVCHCPYAYFGFNIDTLEEKHPDIFANGLPDELMEKYEEHLRPHLMAWDGVWPGVLECREYGFWCKWVEGKGWQKCSEDDPDASEDLNELAARSHWDKEKKRYMLVARQDEVQHHG